MLTLGSLMDVIQNLPFGSFDWEIMIHDQTFHESWIQQKQDSMDNERFDWATKENQPKFVGTEFTYLWN